MNLLERQQLERERAMAIDKLKKKSSGTARRRLKNIYDHLPADMVKYITKVYLKHHK
jgi:hypothetical protein